MFQLFDNKMNPIIYPEGADPLDIFISSIDKERITERLEGMDGVIDYGSTFNTRSIELDLWLESRDTQDYRLLRNAVYAMFQTTDTLYISESYERGKRYKVSVDKSFIPDRIPDNQTNAEARITCSLVGLPFSESIGTTRDIDSNQLNAEHDMWAFGMGLQSDEDTYKYKHTVSRGESFKIYNAGDITVHPFAQDMDIKISGVNGSNNYLELKNETNGSVFRTTKGVKNTEDILISGATITSNGLQYLRNTNRGFIQLSPGMNYFTIDGASRATVEFDFRFYYY